MELLVLPLLLVWYLLCLTIPLVTYILIFIDTFNYLNAHRSLLRRVLVGGIGSACAFAGIWIYSYELALTVCMIPFLVAPPIRLGLLIKQCLASKQCQKKDKIKLTLLVLVSLLCVAMLGTIVWALCMRKW